MISLFKMFGKSMEPVLKENDIVLVKKSRSLKNLVCFKMADKFMCKRLRRVEEEGLFVEGYNPKSIDSRLFGLVPFEDMIGYPFAIIYPFERMRLL